MQQTKKYKKSNKLLKVPENLTIYRLKSSLQMYIAMHYNVMYYNVMYIAMHWICIASVAQTNATTHFGTHEHPQTCNRYFVCARWLREKINVLHDASFYYSTDALYSCGGFIIADSWSIGGRLVWVTSGYIAPRQKDIYIANTYICTSYMYIYKRYIFKHIYMTKCCKIAWISKLGFNRPKNITRPIMPVNSPQNICTSYILNVHDWFGGYLYCGCRQQWPFESNVVKV